MIYTVSAFIGVVAGIARLLVGYRVDALIADSNEMTPIRLAKKFDQPEVVYILESNDEK